LAHLLVRRIARLVAGSGAVAALGVENAVLRHQLSALRRSSKRLGCIDTISLEIRGSAGGRSRSRSRHVCGAQEPEGQSDPTINLAVFRRDPSPSRVSPAAVAQAAFCREIEFMHPTGRFSAPAGVEHARGRLLDGRETISLQRLYVLFFIELGSRRVLASTISIAA
jgi:hypothetical protein